MDKRVRDIYKYLLTKRYTNMSIKQRVQYCVEGEYGSLEGRNWAPYNIDKYVKTAK